MPGNEEIPDYCIETWEWERAGVGQGPGNRGRQLGGPQSEENLESLQEQRAHQL